MPTPCRAPSTTGGSADPASAPGYFPEAPPRKLAPYDGRKDIDIDEDFGEFTDSANSGEEDTPAFLPEGNIATTDPPGLGAAPAAPADPQDEIEELFCDSS
eukprot:COSAG01_NODE_16135_length_1267_cov_1.892123_2_plen_101_part_00